MNPSKLLPGERVVVDHVDLSKTKTKLVSVRRGLYVVVVMEGPHQGKEYSFTSSQVRRPTAKELVQ